ncbi:MAG: right-handed parallel beta-helix repeat-containing protein [Methylocella sp.]
MKIFGLLLAIIPAMIMAALLAAPANAQATRTWVSGVGDDANPCSRTAPCKTFAGAISKTAPGGEIDALDPGGFGTLTITKAITIDGGEGQVASVLAAGTVGFTINAGAADRVILRNLTINGASTGTNGINFVSAASLSVEHCTIMNFSNVGINFQPSIHASLVLTDSNLEANVGGALIGSATTGVSHLNVIRSSLHRSGSGVMAAQNSVLQISSSLIANNAGDGAQANGATAQVTLDSTTITRNGGDGVHALNGGIVRMSNDTVSFNASIGLLAESGGQILTFSNNWVAGNTSDGSRTGTIAPQ